MKTFKDHNIFIFDYNFDMQKLNESMQTFVVKDGPGGKYSKINY